MTSASTDPKIKRSNGFWKIRQIRLITTEIAVIINSTCLADSFARFTFFCPIYCAQTIAPPAASAENAWITSTLIESTNDTAEIAADPTLLTIIVSAVPMMEFRSCSRTTRYQKICNHFICEHMLFVPFSFNSLFPLLLSYFILDFK